MNKKGFISTSVVLVLFLLFLFLLLGLLSVYSNNRSILNKEKEDIKNGFNFNSKRRDVLVINEFELSVVYYENNTISAILVKPAEITESLTEWYKKNIDIVGGVITRENDRINITIPNVLLSGEGTINNPYTIKEASYED